MRKWMLAGLALVAAGMLPTLSSAQDYPTRSIKLVVPFPAGGPSDIIARVLGQKMGEILGQTIVIENKGGAGGINGVDSVAKSEPNGYTIVLSSPGAIAINPSAQTNMPYNVQKDLAPIVLAVRVPEVIVVASGVPAKTIPALVALAKAKPGTLNFASTGNGSMPHLAAELFKIKAGIDVVHIPYRGAAPAVNDLLGNQVQFMFADIPVLLPHIQAGTFTAIGIGSTKRSPVLPDLKTMGEQGLPDVLADNWYGLFAPAGTPPAIIEKLNRVANEALKTPDVKDKLGAQGVDMAGGTPAEFSALIVSDTKKWGDVIKAAGVKLD